MTEENVSTEKKRIIECPVSDEEWDALREIAVKRNVSDSDAFRMLVYESGWMRGFENNRTYMPKDLDV